MQTALVEALAGIGQGDAARGAGQQGHPELGFQLLDAEADRRAGLLQLIGRTGERAGLDHGAKQFEAVETDHGMGSLLSN
ncbi:hypothetical protein D3C71_1924280 [compost metagenome]